MGTTTMTYGGGSSTYNFTPVPFLTITRTPYKTQEGAILGSTYIFELDGTLTPLPNSSGGYINVDALQDSLTQAFQVQGQKFEVKCDGNTLIQAYPRIENGPIFSKSNDNWHFTSPFNITLAADEVAPGSGTSPFIKEFSESWNLEAVEDKPYYSFILPSGGTDASPYQFRLTHNVSAVGIRHYNASGLVKEAWEQARAYVIPQLGFDATQLTGSGVINLTSANFQGFNHTRVQNTNETDGSFTVNENWYAITPSGSGVPGNAVEDFTITTTYGTDTGLTAVGVEGSVEGLETKVYGSNPGDFSITQSKYAAASGAWGTIQSRLYQRAQLIGNGVAERAIHIQPISSVVGHSPTKGLITYNYQYNDRPINCFASSLSESINITDNHPTDLFASIFVLGRSAGPVLQNLATRTGFVRELTIEALFQPVSFCATTAGQVTTLMGLKPSGDSNTMVNAFEDQLEGIYSQVFRTVDTEQWNPGQGRYVRNVGWQANNC